MPSRSSCGSSWCAAPTALSRSQPLQGRPPLLVAQLSRAPAAQRWHCGPGAAHLRRSTPAAQAVVPVCHAHRRSPPRPRSSPLIAAPAPPSPQDEEIYPNEQLFLQQQREIGEASHEWTHPPILQELKAKAKALGLWNLWMPVDSAEAAGRAGGGLNNLQYGGICEILGTSNHIEFAAQCTNCTSPDTGNMELLSRFATEEQKRDWLEPLLAGDIRSCYAMTEPNVASSDATNIGIGIERDGDECDFTLKNHDFILKMTLSC